MLKAHTPNGVLGREFTLGVLVEKNIYKVMWTTKITMGGPSSISGEKYHVKINLL